MSRVVDWLKQQANRAKIEVYAIFLAYRDPRVPWYARALAACVAGYAFSPIDLIPDFIPLLGYLDDLILVPLGVWLVIKLIPKDVMAECRVKAQENITAGKPVLKAGAWLLALWLIPVIILIIVFFLILRK
jgi:uncharacterized membrane protein YkvA (DUF1232 family)